MAAKNVTKEMKSFFDALTYDQVNITQQAQTYKDLFAYQGFDPALTFEELKIKALNSGKTKEEFMEDMTALLVYFVSRGSKYTGKPKAKGKTSDEGKNRMNELYATYGITDEYPNNAKDITIPRISSIFPHLCAKLFSMNIGRQVTKSPFYQSLQFPAAASLIPNTPDWDAFFDRWLLWAIEYDKVVNPSKANADKVKEFAGIARRSQFLSTATRVKYMKGLGYAPDSIPVIVKETTDKNA